MWAEFGILDYLLLAAVGILCLLALRPLFSRSQDSGCGSCGGSCAGCSRNCSGKEGNPAD